MFICNCKKYVIDILSIMILYKIMVISFYERFVFFFFKVRNIL